MHITSFNVHDARSITISEPEYLHTYGSGEKWYTNRIKICDADGNTMEINVLSSDKNPLTIKAPEPKQQPAEAPDFIGMLEDLVTIRS
jgi:hypothetical protein